MAFFAAAWMAAAPSAARADIYRYLDDDGVLNFSDQYPAAGAEMIKKIPVPVPLFGQDRFLRGVERGNFNTAIEYAAAKHGLDPHLIRAVIEAESDFNPRAVSRTGAKGLMQLMPSTARRYKVKDVFDPSQNIDGGANYLRDLLKKYRGDLRLALAAYNSGEDTVLRYSGIPPYRETMEYVEKIVDRYGRATTFVKASRAERKKIYRYVNNDGSVLLTDTPRTTVDYE